MTDTFTVLEVVKSLLQPHDIITITGGEPLLQMDALKELLTLFDDIRQEHDIIIETNGTINPQPLYEFSPSITFAISPKLSNSGNSTQLHPNFRDFDFYLKFVICNPELDLKELEGWLKNSPVQVEPSKVILQPNGMEFDYVGKLRSLMDYVKEHKLPYRVLPQLHRLVWGWRRRV
jgi:organic radical activating enzyme